MSGYSIFSTVSEPRGLWRWAVVCCILALAAAPAIPLAAAAFFQPSVGEVWTPSFRQAAADSLLLGLSVSAVSLAVGLPLALLAALYRFPGRRLLALAQALPLLFPSFLPAIGWSNLAAAGWIPRGFASSGASGCIFVLGVQAAPLTFFAAWAAAGRLTASQVDAARLHGGERKVLELTGRACLPVSILTALLGGILSLSEAGAPLILGARSAAIEIRTSFSALYDFELAGRQCLALAGLVLILTAPLLILGLRSLASALLARQLRPAAPYPHRIGRVAGAAGLAAMALVGSVLPAVGLCLPALTDPMFGRAAEKAAATVGPTVAYAGGAGGIAVVLAAAIALLAARDSSLRLLVLGALLTLLALPPAMGALGVIQAASQTPSRIDWLMRSQLTVALVLGLRFLPIPAAAMLRAVGSMPPTWIEAGRLHGVRWPRLLARVILPNAAPAIFISFLLAAVLAAADVTTTHLLQPPGRQSLPVAIFTVMANSPEGLVASLCLLYVGTVVILLAAAARLAHWMTGRK